MQRTAWGGAEQSPGQTRAEGRSGSYDRRGCSRNSSAMTDQATLPLFRRGHETQEAAARKVAPRAPSLREFIYSFIDGRGHYGATNEEIARVLDLHPPTVCGRVRELQGGKRGEYPRRICDSGLRRDTERGCSAIVWTSVKIS